MLLFRCCIVIVIVIAIVITEYCIIVLRAAILLLVGFARGWFAIADWLFLSPTPPFSSLDHGRSIIIMFSVRNSRSCGESNCLGPNWRQGLSCSSTPYSMSIIILSLKQAQRDRGRCFVPRAVVRFVSAMQHEKCAPSKPTPTWFQPGIRRSRMTEWIHVISKVA